MILKISEKWQKKSATIGVPNFFSRKVEYFSIPHWAGSPETASGVSCRRNPRMARLILFSLIQVKKSIPVEDDIC